jgi:hypothetical protein
MVEAGPLLPNHPTGEDGWSDQRILLADYSHKPSALHQFQALS